MGNVLDFVAKAQQAVTATTDRVEREEQAIRQREQFELRCARIEHIPLRVEDRAMLINSTLDEKTFRSLRVVRAWLEKSSAPCLQLGGTTGRGKSIAGADAIAQRGGLFFDAPTLLTTWQWSQGANSRKASEAKDVMARVFAVPMLVLDDVGTERAMDRALMGMMITKILSARPDPKLRTLITHNGGMNFFQETYIDQRLLSRLAQFSIRVTDKGPDLRIAKNRGRR